MAIGKAKKISLDLCIRKPVSVLVAERDVNSRELIVQITDNGIPFPVNASAYSVRIEYLKSDRTGVVDDIPSKNVLSDGTIRVILSDQMCASYGNNSARLMLFAKTSNEVIHTMNFQIIVNKAPIDNNTVISSNEFKSLENALIKVEHLLENLKPITKSEIDEMF